MSSKPNTSRETVPLSVTDDGALHLCFRCVQESGNPGRGSQLEAAGGTGQGDQLCRVPHQAALVIKDPITVLYILHSVLYTTHPWNKLLFKFDPAVINI
jgi:hypothetical protein